MTGRARAILYALRFEAITVQTLKEWTGRTSFIYGTVHSLERQGLILSFERDEKIEVRGGRPRRYYALTTNGRAWIDARKNNPERKTT
jgi:DNA-binding PadR family transcriptional regulator